MALSRDFNACMVIRYYLKSKSKHKFVVDGIEDSINTEYFQQIKSIMLKKKKHRAICDSQKINVYNKPTFAFNVNKQITSRGASISFVL